MTVILPEEWDPSDETSMGLYNQQLLLFSRRLARLENRQAEILDGEGEVCPTSLKAYSGPVDYAAWMDDSTSGSGGTTAITRIYRSAVYSLANNNILPIPMTAELVDDDALHVANATKIIAKAAGVVVITGALEFPLHATGYRKLFIGINGTMVEDDYAIPSGISPDQLHCGISYKLAIGDYVELYAFQNSGAAMNVGGTTQLNCNLTVSYTPAGGAGTAAANRYLPTSWGPVPTLVKVDMETFPLTASTLEFDVTPSGDYVLYLVSGAEAGDASGNVELHLAYNVPVGFKGWALHAIRMIYELHFEGVNASDAVTVTLTVTDPINGTTVTTTQAHTEVDFIISKAYPQEITISRDQMKTLAGLRPGGAYLITLVVALEGVHDAGASISLGRLEINYDCP